MTRTEAEALTTAALAATPALTGFAEVPVRLLVELKFYRDNAKDAAKLARYADMAARDHRSAAKALRKRGNEEAAVLHDGAAAAWAELA